MIVAEWITDDLAEPVAIAICYGGFAMHRPPQGPVAYWEGVADEAKREYRNAARRLLAEVSVSGRFARSEPSEASLAEYMKTMRLSNLTHAKANYRAMYQALPTIFDYAARGVS